MLFVFSLSFNFIILLTSAASASNSNSKNNNRKKLKRISFVLTASVVGTRVRQNKEEETKFQQIEIGCELARARVRPLFHARKQAHEAQWEGKSVHHHRAKHQPTTSYLSFIFQIQLSNSICRVLFFLSILLPHAVFFSIVFVFFF